MINLLPYMATQKAWFIELKQREITGERHWQFADQQMNSKLKIGFQFKCDSKETHQRS